MYNLHLMGPEVRAERGIQAVPPDSRFALLECILANRTLRGDPYTLRDPHGGFLGIRMILVRPRRDIPPRDEFVDFLTDRSIHFHGTNLEIHVKNVTTIESADERLEVRARDEFASIQLNLESNGSAALMVLFPRGQRQEGIFLFSEDRSEVTYKQGLIRVTIRGISSVEPGEAGFTVESDYTNTTLFFTPEGGFSAITVPHSAQEEPPEVVVEKVIQMAKGINTPRE